MCCFLQCIVVQKKIIWRIYPFLERNGEYMYFFLQEEYREKERMLAHFLIPIYTTSNHFFLKEKKNDIFTKKNHEPLHVYCNICDKNLELAETKTWKNSAIMCLYISGWPEKIKLRNGSIRIFSLLILAFILMKGKKVHMLDLLFL